jgi:outer membrane immunogenic protein
MSYPATSSTQYSANSRVAFAARAGGLVAFGLFIASTLAAGAADLDFQRPTPTDAFAGPWIGVFGEGATTSPNGSWSVTRASLTPLPSVISALNSAGSGTITANGGGVGLQGGWNLRFNSNFVLGADADLGVYDLRGSRSASGTVPVFDVPYTFDQKVRTDWEGSLRLRGGYVFNNFALAFVEAGPALANVHYSSSYWDGADETEYKSLQSVKAGLSVGAGAEFAISDRLTVKAEYVFSHFPSVTGAGTSTLEDGSTAYVSHSSGALDQSAIRVGLNYYLK